MGIVRRYRTSWSRHHRSRGFGIHSPFAFRFVREVLGERLPYYAYDQITTLHKTVIAQSGSRWPHTGIITLKHAKMLYRIVNHFNPSHLLQVGAGSGVTSACMLAVNSQSRLSLYEPHLNAKPVARRVLESMGERVQCYDEMIATLADYRNLLPQDAIPFVLVNDLQSQDEYQALVDYLTTVVMNQAVIVLRNVHRQPLIKQLWLTLKAATPMGQTYTNEKLAIIYATPKLQREDFFLWL